MQLKMFAHKKFNYSFYLLCLFLADDFDTNEVSRGFSVVIEIFLKYIQIVKCLYYVYIKKT